MTGRLKQNKLIHILARGFKMLKHIRIVFM